MPALHTLNLAITFFLELAMLIALGYWGWHTGDTLLMKITLAISTPSGAAIIWGAFMAPKSKWRLKGIAYLIVKALLFAWAAICLYAAGQPTLAIIFIVIAVINQILLFVWGGHAETVVP